MRGVWRGMMRRRGGRLMVGFPPLSAHDVLFVFFFLLADAVANRTTVIQAGETASAFSTGARGRRLI